MTLRIEITLQTSHTTIVAAYNEAQNRLIVTELVSPDPRIIDGLHQQAKELGLQPSKEILEANAPTRGGTEELPWGLLANYSLLSKRTQSIIRRSFAEIFAKITFAPDGYNVAYNEISNTGRIRLYLGDDTYVWLDNVKKLAVFID